MERAYTEADLKDLSRGALVALIEHQIGRWPLTKSKLGKENMSNLRAKLLDPSLGFTTTMGLVHPSVNGSSAPATIVSTADCKVLPLVTADNISAGALSPAVAAGESTTAVDLEDTNDSIKDVNLLINDFRSGLVSNTFQRIKVKLIDLKGCEIGEWRASAADIISSLQKSVGRLSGSGRIGFPAQFDASYTEYFVHLIADHPVQSLEFQPEFLVIPNDSGRLTLRVHPLPNNTAVQSPRAEMPAIIEPKKEAGIDVKETTTKYSNNELSWLKDKIKSVPGYATFHANQNKVLNNIDRVNYWRFLFNVNKQFYKTSWPPEISSSAKKIPKAAIQAALHIGTTAFAQSIQMIEIIDCYTTDGANHSTEVVAEIHKSNVDDANASVLRTFLTQWAKDHPVHIS